MAGHSHWAGIKHKKGRADQQRSKVFSKLSKEITVAAKLGDKDPNMNSRLRSAIQSARFANMPKENIGRAIDKSETNTGLNFENIGNRVIDVWDGEPEGVYVPTATKAEIVCLSDSAEIFIAGAKFNKTFDF